MNMNMNTNNVVLNANANATNANENAIDYNTPLRIPKPFHRPSPRRMLGHHQGFLLSSSYPGGITVDRVMVLGAEVTPKQTYTAWFFLAPRETKKTHHAAFTLLCRIACTILNFVFCNAIFTNQGCGFGKQMGEFISDDVDYESDCILPVFFIDDLEKDLPNAKRYFDSKDEKYWRNSYGGGKPKRKLGETRKYAGTKGICISFEPNDLCTHPFSFCGLKMYFNTRIDSEKFYYPDGQQAKSRFTHLYYCEAYKEHTLVLNYDAHVDLEMLEVSGFDAWSSVQNRKPKDAMIGWSDEEYEDIADTFDGIWKTFHAYYRIRWFTDGRGNENIRAYKSGCLYQVIRLITSCLPPGMDVNKFMHYIHGNIYTDLLSIQEMLTLDTCRNAGGQINFDANAEIINPIAARYPDLDLNFVPTVDYLTENMDEFLSGTTIQCYGAFDAANRNDILSQAYPNGWAEEDQFELDQTVFLKFAHNFVDVVFRNGHYTWRTTRGFNFRNNGLYRRVGGIVDLMRPRREDVNAGEDPINANDEAPAEREPVHIAPAHENLRKKDDMYHIEENVAYEILNSEFQPASQGHKFTLAELRSLLDLEKRRGDLQGREAGLILMMSNLLDKYNDGTLDGVYFSSSYLTCNEKVREEIDKLVENIAKKYEKAVKKMAKTAATMKPIPFGEKIRSNFAGDDNVFDQNVRNGIANMEVRFVDQGMVVKNVELAEEVRPVLARNTQSPDSEGIRVHSVLCEKYYYVKPWWIPQFFITFICMLLNISYKCFYRKYKDDSRMMYVNERLYWNTYRSTPHKTLQGPELYAEIIRVHETGEKFYYIDPELPSMSSDTLIMAMIELGLYDGFFQCVQSKKIGLNTALMDMVLKTPYFQQQCQNPLLHIDPFHLNPTLLVILFLVPFLYVPVLSVSVYQLPQLLYQKIMSLVSGIEWQELILLRLPYLLILYMISLIASVVVILNHYENVIFCHLMLGLTQLLTAMIVKTSFDEYTLIISLIVLIVLTVINYPMLNLLSKMNPTARTKFQERSILEVILLNVFMVLCLSLLKMLYSGYLSSLNTSLSENVLNMLSNIWQMKDLSFVKAISVLSKHTLNLGSWMQSNLLCISICLVILLITMVLICQMMPSLNHVSVQLRVPIKFILVILVIISGVNACQVKCSPHSQMGYRTLSSCISSFHGWEGMKLEQSLKATMGYSPLGYVKDMEKTCSVLNTLNDFHLMSSSASENQLKLVLSVDSITRYVPTVNSKIGLWQYLKSSGTSHILDRLVEEEATYCSQNSYQCSLRLRHVQYLQKWRSGDWLNCTQFMVTTRDIWMENYEEGISIMVNYINNYLKTLKIALMMTYQVNMEFLTLNLVDSASGITFVSKEFDMISQQLNDLNIRKCLEFLQNNKNFLKITSRSFIPTMNEFMNVFIHEIPVSNTLSQATLIEFPLVLAHHTGVVFKDYATMLQQRAGLRTGRRIFDMVDAFSDDFDSVLGLMNNCYDGEDISNATLAECYYNATRDFFKQQNSHINPYTVFIFETSYAYFHVSQYFDKYSYFALLDPRLIYMVVGRIMPSVGRLVASLQWDRTDFAKDLERVGQLAVSGTSAEVSEFIDSVGVTTFVYQYIGLTFADFVTSNFYHGYFEKDYANRIVSMYYKSHGMFVSVDMKIDFHYDAFFGAWHVFSHAVSRLLYLPESVNQKIHDIISIRDKAIDKYVF